MPTLLSSTHPSRPSPSRRRWRSCSTRASTRPSASRLLWSCAKLRKAIPEDVDYELWPLFAAAPRVRRPGRDGGLTASLMEHRPPPSMDRRRAERGPFWPTPYEPRRRGRDRRVLRLDCRSSPTNPCVTSTRVSRPSHARRCCGRRGRQRDNPRGPACRRPSSPFDGGPTKPGRRPRKKTIPRCIGEERRRRHARVAPDWRCVLTTSKGLGEYTSTPRRRVDGVYLELSTSTPSPPRERTRRRVRTIPSATLNLSTSRRR